MLYWSDQNPVGAGPKLLRASYDGVTTPPQSIVVDGMIGDVVATAVDNQNRIYWVENVNARTDADGNFLIGHQIRRANMDGSNLKVLARDLSRFPTGFALDLRNDHLYWTEYVGGRILRCPLEAGCPQGKWSVGSNPELVLKTFEGRYRSTTPKLGGIAIDSERNVMYWTEDHTAAPPPGEDAMIWGGMVKRANLDGTGVTELFRHTGSEMYEATPFGIALLRA
jgi:sugar lactone lactonase YvrE